MSAAGEGFVEALAKALKKRERDHAPVRTQRVIGRETDGSVRSQRLDAECVTRGAQTNAYQGQTIAEPAGLGGPINRRGTTGVAGITEAASDTILWVERLVPDVYRPGQSYVVSVEGRGFQEGTRFEFLRPGSVREVNEDLVVLGAYFVSDTQYVLEITVVGGATLYAERLPLAYDRPSKGPSS